MEIKSAKSVPLPIAGKHAEHEVTLNSKVLYVQLVTGVDMHGDITVSDSGEIDHGAYDGYSFFYCETCRVDLLPDHIGVDDQWDVL
jgi:hypothetical protein